MKLYNTLTRTKEEFVPLEPGKVRIYACGPTVYNYIHIGNARPLCVFDVLRRYFKFIGYDVTFVQNFTDIDDKIINKANEMGVKSIEVSEKFIEEYKKDASGLNIMTADIHPKVTENIDEIISIIETLIEKGFAYEAEGDVYFSTGKFDEYGKLSHQPLEELEAGARINIGEKKTEPMDFALWKAAKPGEPAWKSPWGEGRPGWHIECSAMARKYLGKTIDIHCGGQDLIFPHHENEIAQSECCNGVPFARYWLHNGYINVDNVKMSKSLGNFFTVRDVAEKYGYEPIRYLMISSHYRSPINYSKEAIEQCVSALSRLYNCRESLDFAISKADKENADESKLTEVKEALNVYHQKFIDAMDDDFNTADALGALFEMVRFINKEVLTPDAAKDILALASDSYAELCDILGLLYVKKKDDAEDSLNDTVNALIEERTQARKEKNWAKADEIRDKLKEMGIVLEDTPQGVKWHKIQD
ncbi:MAG: cysteine--tRNA ligase [Clostridiales bacterium]|jgi:cysteinyl-tRNA synthetase|nr:cysteine--tRNA ligase [Clostridiales bacterium]